jgi:hypothetical protein
LNNAIGPLSWTRPAGEAFPGGPSRIATGPSEKQTDYQQNGDNFRHDPRELYLISQRRT